MLELDICVLGGLHFAAQFCISVDRKMKRPRFEKNTSYWTWTGQ